jgi:hypothetical protein
LIMAAEERARASAFAPPGSGIPEHNADDDERLAELEREITKPQKDETA